jgi:hypothetical protein
MEIKQRAVRRYHYQRLKHKRKDYYGGSHSEVAIGKLVATPTPCSCFMCGNPRRHEKQRLTMQERKFPSIGLWD